MYVHTCIVFLQECQRELFDILGTNVFLSTSLLLLLLVKVSHLFLAAFQGRQDVGKPQ